MEPETQRLWHWFRTSPFAIGKKGGHVVRRLPYGGMAFDDNEGRACCELSAETLWQIQYVAQTEKVIDPWGET